jgi:hypothetical protein
MSAAGWRWLLLCAAALLGASTASGQAVRDDFDPARFREDLLLIQPLFTPPELLPSAPPDADLPQETIELETTAADSAAGATDGAFTVQVIALSHEDGARAVAGRIARRLAVPVAVVAAGELFVVQAGRFDEPAAAGQLKAQIALLSEEYSEAFVVADTSAATTAPADVDRWIEIEAPVVDPEVEPPPDIEPEMIRIQGWRVLLGQYFSLEGAQDFRGKVMARLKRDDVDIKFEEPWYKVLAGNFRTSTEAQQYVDRCRRLGYRSATRIPGEIEVPKETR